MKDTKPKRSHAFKRRLKSQWSHCPAVVCRSLPPTRSVGTSAQWLSVRGGGCRGDPLLKASPLGPRSFSIQAVNSFRGSFVWILKPRIAHPAAPPRPEGAVANRYMSGGGRRVLPQSPPSTKRIPVSEIKAINHFMSPIIARHSD